MISDPREALKSNSPVVHPEGNLVAEIHLGQGDIDKAFTDAEFVFENEYFTGRQEHAHIETEGGAAYYDEAGRLDCPLWRAAPALGSGNYRQNTGRRDPTR